MLDSSKKLEQQKMRTTAPQSLISLSLSSYTTHPVSQLEAEMGEQHRDCGGVVHARQALPHAVTRPRAEWQEALHACVVLRALAATCTEPWNSLTHKQHHSYGSMVTLQNLL
jgi:hypothetical protein